MASFPQQGSSLKAVPISSFSRVPFSFFTLTLFSVHCSSKKHKGFVRRSHWPHACFNKIFVCVWFWDLTVWRYVSLAPLERWATGAGGLSFSSSPTTTLLIKWVSKTFNFPLGSIKHFGIWICKWFQTLHTFPSVWRSRATGGKYGLFFLTTIVFSWFFAIRSVFI